MFKCVGKDGKITYQADPCPDTGDEKKLKDVPAGPAGGATKPGSPWKDGWSADSEVAAIQDTIDAFEKANPNIHVKVVGGITDDKINQATARYLNAAPPPETPPGSGN